MSLSFGVPTIDAGSAGGHYLNKHLRALSERAEVALFSEKTKLSEDASNIPRWDNIRVVQIRGASLLDRLPVRIVQRVYRIANPWALNFSFQWALRRSDDFRAALQNADVVEFQWVEYYGLAKLARKYAPDAKFIGISHDVLTQRTSRTEIVPVLGSSSFGSWLHYFDVRRSQISERRLMSRLDTVIVLSEKDRKIVRAINADSAVHVVDPPLKESSMPDSPPDLLSRSNVVIFVCNFNRDVNEEAAIWLLRYVWPLVVGNVPNATLKLVGSSPSSRLQNAAGEHGTVVVTGFVSSLTPFYGEAKLAVVPLLRGAGVKFKTIDAMLWGIPVVATQVGVEGIGHPSLYSDVTEDPGRMAASIVRVLRDPENEYRSRDAAFEFANAKYSHEAYSDSLHRVYGLAVSADDQ